MKTQELEQDFEQMLKVMDFCPVEIVAKGEKTLATRCWEWLEQKKDQNYKKDKILKEEKGSIVVWDLNHKACKKIKLSDISSHSISNYHGQMYLK